MASTSSVSTNRLSSTLRGYGGLASGLDRDELIEQMSAASRSKIASQKQKQDKLEWQQTALRNITTKCYEFSNKYTSYSSPATNLLSSKMYSRTLVSAIGANSGCISVSGTANSGEMMSIAGIKQLAKQASLSTTGSISDRDLKTGGIELDAGGKLSKQSAISNIAGEALYVKYGSTIYTVSMPMDGDYDDIDKAVETINTQLDKVAVGNNKTLGDVMEIVKNSGGNFEFKTKSGSAGNLVQLAGGTGNILYGLGFLRAGEGFSDLEEQDITISDKSGDHSGSYGPKLTTMASAAQRLSGSDISFSYNGTSKWITLDKYTNDNTIEDVQADLQKKLDKAFGTGRIQVGLDSSGGDTFSLSFKTVNPNGTADNSATLAITAGDGLVGKKGLFDMQAGESNRVNLSATLDKSGLGAFKADANGRVLAFEQCVTKEGNPPAPKKDQFGDPTGELYLSINGTQIKGITTNSSVNDILRAINTADAGVQVSYQSISDRFVITATEQGASGKIEFDAAADGAGENLAAYLFGTQGSWSSAGNLSNQAGIKTGNLALGAGGDLSKQIEYIAGQKLSIEYESQKYDLTMPSAIGNKVTDLVTTINTQLKTVTLADGNKLSDMMIAEKDSSGNLVLRAKNAAAGKSIKLAGGSGDILYGLGFLKEGQSFDDVSDANKTISGKADGLAGSYAPTIRETVAEKLGGSTISFSYNGTEKRITLDQYNDTDTIETVQADLQKKLDDAFGAGNITVGLTKNAAQDEASLSFDVTSPASTLTVTDGDPAVIGDNGLLGIERGQSNRVLLHKPLVESGLMTFNTQAAVDATKLNDGSGELYLSINGKQIHGITENSTVNEILQAINSSDAGVQASYQAGSDSFVLTSAGKGTSATPVFDTMPGVTNLADSLFGTLTAMSSGTTGMPAMSAVVGQDAILEVKYPGSDDLVQITRASNTFELDGLNVTLKKTFGYDASGNRVADTEDITFDAEVDADKTAEAVQQMIDAYNEIVAMVNSECKTKPDRKYPPLTDEQKDEMKDEQIEKWEEKAKQGILFADVDLRMMADNLRTVVNSQDMLALSKIGITTSTSYSDNGKLVFDAETFKAALREDPNGVMDLLTRTAETTRDSNGNTITTRPAGLVNNIKAVLDRYASTSGAVKGILVERAGSIYAPTTVLNNSIQKQLDKLDDYIDTLNDRLQNELDRYIKQFTSLESLINQMNSQSGYLQSMFGG